MTVNNESVFHQQLILAVGTLGGISFAGLILIIQNEPEKISPLSFIGISPHFYLDILLGSLCLISILCMLSCFTMTLTASGQYREDGYLGKFGNRLALTSFIGFMFVIPLMIGTLSPKGGLYIFLIILVLFALFGVAYYLERRSKR